jgi:hypothetical protein
MKTDLTLGFVAGLSTGAVDVFTAGVVAEKEIISVGNEIIMISNLEKK